MFSLSVKLESNSSTKVDTVFYYRAYTTSSGIIEHLMIQLINSTMQTAYLVSIYNCLHSWII